MRIVKIAVSVLLGLECLSAVFQVDETERVVVQQMGRPIYEVIEPGLHVKFPWPYQSATTLDKRYFKYDGTMAREIITKDKKTMVVDTFSYIRIADGIAYLQKLNTEQNALSQTENVIYSEMHNELGEKNFEEILTSQRVAIMESVTARANRQLKEYGLNTNVVRMNKTDLPQENKPSVYERMVAERQRQSMQYRSVGDEKAQIIRAGTDKEVTILLANARAEAQKNRGEGDAEATRIYNAAYGRDPEFFRLYRGLDAAKKALGGSGEIRIIQSGAEPHLQALFGK